MTMTAKKHHSYPLHELFEFGGELILRGLTKEEFIQVCSKFPEYRMERDTKGDISIMAPVKGGTSFRENDLSYYVTHWSKTHKKGRVTSPSGGFDLPNGATKSPDVAWISDDKLATLTPHEIENEFIPVVPDFIIEIRSKSDRLKIIIEKMTDTWIANGVRLAWLIDPYEEKAYIYRADGTEETIEGFDNQLSGEDVLPGFVLELKEFRLFGKK